MFVSGREPRRFTREGQGRLREPEEEQRDRSAIDCYRTLL